MFVILPAVIICFIVRTDGQFTHFGLDRSGANCNQPVTLGCFINSFTTDATWNRNGTSMSLCTAGGFCTVPSLPIGGATFTFAGNGTGIFVFVNSLPNEENNVNWQCIYSGTTNIYTFNIACPAEACHSGGCLILIIVVTGIAAVIATIVICTILSKHNFIIVQPDPSKNIMDGIKITKQGNNMISGLPFSFAWKKHMDHITLLENVVFMGDSNNQDPQWKVFFGTESSREEIVWSAVDLNNREKYGMKGLLSLTIFKPSTGDQGFYEATIDSKQIGIFLCLMIPNFKKKIIVSSIVMVVAVVLIGIIMGGISGRLREHKVDDFCCEVWVIVTAVILSVVVALALSGLLIFFFLSKVHGMELLERSWKYEHKTGDKQKPRRLSVLKGSSNSVKPYEPINDKKARNLAPMTHNTGPLNSLSGKPLPPVGQNVQG